MFLQPAEFIKHPELLTRCYTLEEAQSYTRWLARSHYENFLVASVFLPRKFRRAFYDIYAYCRWADDLGDELGDREASLRWLQWLKEQVKLMYRGEVAHPVFVALRATVERYEIPEVYFLDLIRAFEQDQYVVRYATFADLLEYCRYSAVPVGRLVLWVFGYRDEALMELADQTCIGLQLANFWQDISVDLEKGRIYLPLEWLQRYGACFEDLEGRRATNEVLKAIAHAVEQTKPYFYQGLKLADHLEGRLRLEVRMFNLAGIELLKLIEEAGFNTLERRPTLNAKGKVRVLLKALAYRTLAHGY